jgi:hypothetical protein
VVDRLILSGWLWAAMLLAAAAPGVVALWEFGPRAELWLLGPVVVNTEVASEEVTEEEVVVSLRFDKVRPCEEVDLVWEGRRGVLNWRPADPAEPAARRRLTGTGLTTRPLHVPSVTSLDGTRAVIFHRCHPLWLTESRFYPPTKPEAVPSPAQ